MTGLLGFCGGGGGTSGVRPSFGSIANGPAAGAAPVRVGPLVGVGRMSLSRPEGQTISAAGRVGVY